MLRIRLEMPNHVHLILTPATPEGLGRALGETHRRYASVINARLRVTGHLFQSRYGSVAMDEEHLMAAARYVALNPVRARLAARAEDWRWSSVRAHLAGEDDGVVATAPILARCAGRFADLIDAAPDARQMARPACGRNDRPSARIGELPRQHRRPDRSRRAAGQARAEEKGIK